MFSVIVFSIGKSAQMIGNGAPLDTTKTTMSLSKKNAHVNDPLFHPNPEFRRKDWIDLNGKWRFRFDDDEMIQTPAEITDWPLSIRVPFSPESRMSEVKAAGFHHCCWYE